MDVVITLSIVLLVSVGLYFIAYYVIPVMLAIIFAILIWSTVKDYENKR